MIGPGARGASGIVMLFNPSQPAANLLQSQETRRGGEFVGPQDGLMISGEYRLVEVDQVRWQVHQKRRRNEPRQK